MCRESTSVDVSITGEQRICTAQAIQESGHALRIDDTGQAAMMQSPIAENRTISTRGELKAGLSCGRTATCHGSTATGPGARG